ncbi:hypothetical protein VTO42DRAFT_7712 [Malbranchea cinnamomea]
MRTFDRVPLLSAQVRLIEFDPGLLVAFSRIELLMLSWITCAQCFATCEYPAVRSSCKTTQNRNVEQMEQFNVAE